MFNYLQRLTVLAIAIFLFSGIIASSTLTPAYHSIVYAAVITCGPYTDPRSDPCNGTYGDDNMRGDAGPNKMNGLGGNDQVSGGLGNDLLHGGYGDDDLSGGPGNDDLFGSVGADSLKCGAGYDQIGHFNQSEGDTKSSDCERLYPPYLTNTTGISNDTLTGFPANFTGFPANQTLSATKFSSK
jgi:Ca2+-binding RTX toxin-like protein